MFRTIYKLLISQILAKFTEGNVYKATSSNTIQQDRYLRMRSDPISSHQSLVEITMGSHLKVVEKLSWENHINEVIIPKVLKGLCMLRELWPMLNIHQISLYQSLVMPHFDYCSNVWGNCGVVLGSKLQKLQNRAARIITWSGYEIRSTEILASLGWCDLETRQNRQKVTLMFKIMNDIAPGYLKQLFIPVNKTHEHHLRSSETDVKIPQPHPEYLKCSLSYSGAQLWNSLPSALKNIHHCNNFNNLISTCI